MNDANFEVEEAGEPRLLGQGEEPPEEQPVEQAVALPSWTAEEAAAKAAEILTTGLLIGYVARHQRVPTMATMQKLLCHPAEFPSTGTAMVPFLNRFVPKGGIADVGISASAMLGEIGLALGKRWQALGEKPAPAPRTEPAGAPAPAGADPRPETSAPPNGADATSSYRLRPELVRVVVGRPRPDDSLTGMGV